MGSNADRLQLSLYTQDLQSDTSAKASSSNGLVAQDVCIKTILQTGGSTSLQSLINVQMMQTQGRWAAHTGTMTSMIAFYIILLCGKAINPKEIVNAGL